MRHLGKIVLAVMVLVAVSFGWKYYADNYQSRTAYAVVPKSVPEKLETVGSNGKKIANSYSYKYNFNFVLENGKKKTIEFELIGENPKPFVPGTLVKADVANKRVIKGPNSISKEDVPEKVRNNLNI